MTLHLNIGADGRQSNAYLDIRHEPVISVLVLMVDRIHDMLVPERREDVPDDRLAALAADRVLFDAAFLHNLRKVLQLLDPDDIAKSQLESIRGMPVASTYWMTLNSSARDILKCGHK